MDVHCQMEYRHGRDPDRATGIKLAERAVVLAIDRPMGRSA